MELLLPVKTSLVTAALAERQLGYVVSVDLTPGVVGGVGEGAAIPGLYLTPAHHVLLVNTGHISSRVH